MAVTSSLQFLMKERQRLAVHSPVEEIRNYVSVFTRNFSRTEYVEESCVYNRNIIQIVEIIGI